MKGNFDAVNQRVNEYICELNNHGYIIHHNAWAGGYLARDVRSVTVRAYETRRFSGIVIEAPSFSSSRYHNRIYFVKKP